MPEGTANSLTVRIAIGLYCLVGAGFLGQGLRYLVSDALMDYHMAVIGIPWDAIGHSYQALLLGLLRGLHNPGVAEPVVTFILTRCRTIYPVTS